MLESIIRPFTDDPSNPTPYTKPGQKGVENVHVRVGMKGGTKTFNYSGSMSASLYTSKKHMESAPRSSALQGAMQDASSAGAGGGYEAALSKFQTDLQDGAGNYADSDTGQSGGGSGDVGDNGAAK